MKTLTFALPALDDVEAADLLEAVTGQRGVVAAMVGPSSSLEVVLATGASPLFLRDQITYAIWASGAASFAA